MLTVLLPENEYSPALRELLLPRLPAGSDIRDPDAGLEGLADRHLLFAVALDAGGCSMAYYRMLSRLRSGGEVLAGCTAGCIVTGAGYGACRESGGLRLHRPPAGGGDRLTAQLPHTGADWRNG